MYWNIENLSQQVVNDCGPQLMDLIANVARHNGVHLLAMNELRSQVGAAVGHELSNRLTGNGANWAYQASQAFGDNRQEQYLFVWNKSVLSNTGFMFDFPDPAKPGKLIGFPNQKTSDRPPYLGRFLDTSNPQRELRIAAFHAPAPSYWPGVRDGNRSLGRVAAFQGGDVCVVMGDCNIKFDANSYNVGSKGEAAFGPLRALAPGFSQTACVPGNGPPLSSLIGRHSQWPGMTVADAYSEPYDQIFLRNAANQVVNIAGRVELLSACSTGNYLEASLKALTNQFNLPAPITYATVDQVFRDFRELVSDHMPVVLDLTY